MSIQEEVLKYHQAAVEQLRKKVDEINELLDVKDKIIKNWEDIHQTQTETIELLHARIAILEMDIDDQKLKEPLEIINKITDKK
ncbi:MAG: hypothetical protein Unbinned805contig1001_45 [Prokaryotic dsDNA virus sp.]|nr:MAG: hypothetical protein Unbinned805contig1001_45 [Prokaryotic dsDNA virus sp.]|tara:strand:+ start:3141 stop:3392 length:252 start_codon:yes stop_codon:yes gene_type:complete